MRSAKRGGLAKSGCARLRARAAEDGDLAHVLVGREHAERVAQLLQRVGEQARVAARRRRSRQSRIAVTISWRTASRLPLAP